MNKNQDKNARQTKNIVWTKLRKQQLLLPTLMALGFTLAIAPVVYAASDVSLESRTTWAIGILGLVTISLVIYLFVVVFQPERF
ncbi:MULTISPECIES: K(+)-transporting ATPase subunit F [unclassified Tolypothrix]|uniref:K(+)-transporting ATPase subunit F n=1 Tax=unclassified Tolypothrix TaxID=2649714 RepID=UPI0005EAC3C4|nr:MULTISPECIES: K(+)-transporting ATPase subunit F [unclassified Tolypothrix]BAY93005.1 potassium-dependent ATPase G chain [Microchaete diplosiphon NIES-3275]EKF02701.1 K+-transporting ATPase, F subunit [Tolypothrix sp. PCC 7601]MBE9087148.1 K(+)-transporting ATPase subunit F [Tolypothrix sp. LEGE 11397]UYD26899.1 K(+)-transporting ATPase subunit F [Tolypothrix sp. PCC 7712]UYD37241.1 K(+)-transporting ATPase subunit F [Tolypothrix sp. PCC 7601]